MSKGFIRFRKGNKLIICYFLQLTCIFAKWKIENMGHKEHKHQAPLSARVWVVTVSDTRTWENDESGTLLEEKLSSAGHIIANRSIITDDEEKILAVLNEAVSKGDFDAVIITGGTGISPRDNTIEAVHKFMEKELTGFGELFRRLSYDEIGTAAIMSRATAGVGKGIIVIAIPGSKNAVRLACDEIIIPELSHMLYEMKKRSAKY